MKKGTIFIDLDGTIFDVSEKIYLVYRDILANFDAKILQKDEYLRLKREKTPLDAILKKTSAGDLRGQFEKLWDGLIESDHYLDFDKLVPKAKETLATLGGKFDLVLVTLRNNELGLEKELEKNGLKKIFRAVLVASGRGRENKHKLKSKMISGLDISGRKCAIVGDTETDILAGKDLKIKTVAVCGGMRRREFLAAYNPDFLLNNISEMENWCNCQLSD
jgi:phosphoglycolate phosphatase-like HAD superfamily hydrolase